MRDKKPIKSVVYELSFELAMKVFELSKKLSREESYSLTDQIRRSSHSACINIREGYAKQKYEKVFISHLTDSLGSSEETRGWLAFAAACKYISQSESYELDKNYQELSPMINALSNNWHTF